MTVIGGSDRRVVIVGAGVAGLSVAYSLLSRGATEVTVVDAGHVGAGSSSLSVGMVETQYFEPVDVHARVMGREFVDKIVVDHGLHFVRNGFLRPATTIDHLTAFDRSVEVQRRFGVADAQVLSASEVAAVAPPINTERVIGGLWRPSDGYLDGYLFTSLLARLTKERGGRIAQRHRLIGAEKTAQGAWTLQMQDHPNLIADIVVNAAGPWADRVARILDTEVAVKPERHQSLTVELGQAPAWRLPCVVEYIPGSTEDGLSLRHEGNRQLFATLHNERSVLPRADADQYNSRADQEVVDKIVELTLDRFPGLEDCAIGHGWAGLYPMTPDGSPVVGADPADTTIIHAAGGGGSGIQLATAMGDVAADWVLDGRSDRLTSGDLWSPARFVMA